MSSVHLCFSQFSVVLTAYAPGQAALRVAECALLTEGAPGAIKVVEKGLGFRNFR